MGIGLLLWVLMILGSASVSAYGLNQEPTVQVQVRTFGWGMQGTFVGEGLSDSLPVHSSQFSGPVRYSGPVTLSLYTRAHGLDEFQTKSTDSIGAEHSDVTPPPPAVTVSFPEGSERVLLLFTRGNGSGNRLRVAVLDDSQTKTEGKNVQFYNFTPLELYVQAFGSVKRIASGGQTVWQLSDQQDHSSLAIAIRDPEDKILYTSRFRLRATERMIFFARLAEPSTRDTKPTSPQLIVTPVSARIISEVMDREDLSNDIALD